METLNLDFNRILETATELTITYLPRVVLAILVFLVGLRFIRYLTSLLKASMQRTKLNKEIQPFLSSLLSISLKVLLIFSAAGIVGIETTSFVAVLAAAGFAVGLALQGSLSNFASGIMVLIFRPYTVADLVEIDERVGYVAEIQIFNTILTTLDNRTVIIPNAQAVSSTIINYSTRKTLRVDLEIPIPYQESFDEVSRIILASLTNIPEVLEKPEPFVGIHAFDSHSILLAVRPYAKAEDYWIVYYEAHRRIKKALHDHQIPVAYSEGVELGKIGA